MLLGLAALAAAPPDKTAPVSRHLEPALRRPVALAVTDGGRWLFTANRRSGTVSVIDAQALEVRAEWEVGKSLSDLAGLPGQRLLTLDDGTHELLLLGEAGPGLRVMERLPLSPYPARLALSADARRAFVSSPWSKRVDVVERGEGQSLRRVTSLELPFPPREILPLEENRLIVADAFGGRLGLIDLEQGRVERVIEIPGHNIRGLAIQDGHLIATHQRVEKNARTDREDIFWGVFITNGLLSLDLGALSDPGEDGLRGRRVLDLGNQAMGSGDPDRLITTEGGEVVVSLAGVGRVAIGRTSWPRLDQVRVGRRPTALAASPDGRLFVANTHSDSVTVVDIARRQALGEISLGPAGDLEAADRGELLFYDASLSLRSWMSCHSCHSEGHTSGILTDTQGDGSYGAPKRVPSLFGVGESGPWAWNGQIKTLSAQIEKSLRTTLHASSVSAEQVTALEAYLRALEPPVLPANEDAEAVRQGEALFAQKCSRCHTPPAYTSAGPYEVGLVDEVGNRRFNPPSLRGVKHRSPLFHDGRARDVNEVLTRFRHPAGEIPPSDVRDLVSFLKSL
jgi:cytochrome c peroxidase